MQANDLEIRTAALQLLGAGRNPTMADIAARAGVSRQTLYAHYPSRDALYRDLATRLAELATTTMSEPLPPGRADALKAWIRRAWTLLVVHPALLNPALCEAITAIGSDTRL